jgi:hypothetical protein
MEPLAWAHKRPAAGRPPATRAATALLTTRTLTTIHRVS